MGVVFMFSKGRALEKEIENYFYTVQEAGMTFNEGLKHYLQKRYDCYVVRVQEIRNIEHEADRLRRNIKRQLYTDMLIPDARGDVLGLLETVDDMIDEVKSVMVNLEMERPHFYDFLTADFLQMGEVTENCLFELSKAAKTFFTNIGVTNNYINRVIFYEKEVDKIEARLKKAIFQNNLVHELSERMHLRYFVEEFASITDAAEDVCERLSISVIKRSM